MTTPMPHAPVLRAAAALLLLATAPVAWAQQLLPAQSEIRFTTRQMGVPVEGRFGKFDAQLQFDPKKPEAGRIAFSIDLTSAQIGAPETVAELRKPGWFDSARVPQATFTSTGITPGGPGRFDVAGTLSIKGIARPVTIPVMLAQQGATTRAEGSFTLKRLDYKIGDGEWNDTSLVGNDVVVKFRLALAGVPPV